MTHDPTEEETRMTPLTVTLAVDGSIPIPAALRHAGLSAGDQVVLESDGHTLLITPAEPDANRRRRKTPAAA